MIEAKLTKNNKTIGQLKDDSVYLLKNMKHIMPDIPNENFVDDDNKKDEIVEIVDKRKYEQAVSKCKKLKLSLKQWLGVTLKSFQNNNMIMYILNTEKL